MYIYLASKPLCSTLFRAISHWSADDNFHTYILYNIVYGIVCTVQYSIVQYRAYYDVKCKCTFLFVYCILHIEHRIIFLYYCLVNYTPYTHQPLILYVLPEWLHCIPQSTRLWCSATSVNIKIQVKCNGLGQSQVRDNNINGIEILAVTYITSYRHRNY